MFEPIPDEVENAGKKLLDAAYRVHTVMGPGLMESIYEKCMCIELSKRGVEFQSQVSLPIVYDGETIDSGLRLDLLVERCVIGELKAVQELTPLFHAQLLSQLKISGLRLGFLINFNVVHLKDGIKRIVA